jgi:hypothetical protein
MTDTRKPKKETPKSDEAARLPPTRRPSTRSNDGASSRRAVTSSTAGRGDAAARSERGASPFDGRGRVVEVVLETSYVDPSRTGIDAEVGDTVEIDDDVALRLIERGSATAVAKTPAQTRTTRTKPAKETRKRS